MSLFSKHKTHTEGGVLIDIGSGSVGVALVEVPKGDEPAKILWSHREYILSKTKKGEAEKSREIQTALMNALLELGSAGLRSELYTEAAPKLSHIQVTMSAPWAHTATKTLRYNKDENFKVTKHFITDLIKTSENETTDSKTKMSEIGLVTISNTVAEILLNEYAVEDPIDAEATSITLSIITSAIDEKMLKTIQTSCEKILPDTEIMYFSFIDVLHKTLRHLKPNTSEVCIIDVTDQATELGIVRDDVLRYCAFRPTGLQTLAETLTDELSFTKEESYSILKRSDEELGAAYKVKEKEIIDAIFVGYENELISLFNDTNDDLSISQSLFIHTDSQTEEFFSKRILNAAQAISPSKKTVHFVNENLLAGIESKDSALAVCAYFFKESPTFKHSSSGI